MGLGPGAGAGQERRVQQRGDLRGIDDAQPDPDGVEVQVTVEATGRLAGGGKIRAQVQTERVAIGATTITNEAG